MKKKKNLWSLLSSLLNLNTNDEEENFEELSLPEMHKELLKQIKQAENSVALSMAQVGVKRVALRGKLAEHDALMQKAELLEKEGKFDLAKQFVARTISLKTEIAGLTEHLKTLDGQAQSEIVVFRSLEKKAAGLANKITVAEQKQRFNQIRERIGTNVNGLESNLVNQIEARIENIELQEATLTAKLALQSEEVENAKIDMEANHLLAEHEADKAYKQLKEKVSAGAITEGEEVKTTDPTDEARNMLDNPAFGNTVFRK